MKILDKKNRSLKDIRISVTDKCKFRCTYCMPKEINNFGLFLIRIKEIEYIIKEITSLYENQ